MRFLIPRLEYILFMALFWSIAANGPRLLNFDGDLPRHLLVGRLIRETGNIPLTDTFSFRTVGYPSIPHEWLSQVILSISNDLLGLSGVILLTALIITATWVIVFAEANRRTTSLFASLFITTLGIAAAMIHVLPRPHIFTYLLTALWIVVLERIKSGRQNVWWWLPVLMLMWVNMHGMFVIGIVLWGLYLVGSFLDRPSREWFTQPVTISMLIAGLLSLAATFLSPSGFKIWEAVISLGSNSYITSRIPEYQSANFHLPETWPFILLLLLTITGFARTASKTAWTYILLTTAFTAVALYTSRMIPLFAIAVVPISAQAVGDWLEQDFSSSRFGRVSSNISEINTSSNGVVWMVLLVIVVALLFKSGTVIDPQNKGNVFDNKFFPVQAVAWLNQHPQNGHMFNEFDWGGYLLLKLSPRQQIFMDGHTHIYGEKLTREYETIISLANGWQGVLDRYQVQWAILRTGSPLVRELETVHWKIVYQDDTATILSRH
ncbi:MAG: hypothetical protein ACM3PS_07095 [Syntrophothermus sp.]